MDLIRWEARYRDGTQVLEERGARYEDLDRRSLQSFLLRDPQGPIVELVADYDRTGHNLFYRRRTVMLDGQTKTMYVLGWIPQGPYFAVDPEDFEVYESQDLIQGDPVFYPPIPYFFERWTVEGAPRIVNPSYEHSD